MGIVTNEVFVETMGRCFFCQVVSPPNHAVQEPNYPSVSPKSTCSLQSLSLYLRLDMKKVLQEGGLIPPRPLTKACRLKLKAEMLCGKCSFINDKFSKLYIQMEKVEMEMTSCLQVILEMMEKVEVTAISKAKEKRTLDDSQFVSLDMGKLLIVEVLRKETLQKCKIKLETTFPRVKLEQYRPIKDTPTQKLRPFMRADEKVEGSVNSNGGGDDDDFEITNDKNDDDANSIKREDFEVDLEEISSRLVVTGNKELQSVNCIEANSRLRSLHKCVKCLKTFSTPLKLEEHRKSHATLEEYEEMETPNFGKPSSDDVAEGRDPNENGVNQSIVKLEMPDSEPDIAHEWDNSFSDHSDITGAETKLESKLDSRKDKVTGNQQFSINPKSNKYRCLICSREFFQRASFQFHYKNNHAEKKISCPACPKKYATKSFKDRHYREVHQNQTCTFKCRGCSRNFSTRNFLRTHLRYNEKCRSVPISRMAANCKYTTVTPSHSNLVERPQPKINPETDKLVCNMCKMEFVSEPSFRLHYKNIHLGIKYRCGACSRVFNSKRWTSYHYRKEHLGMKAKKVTRPPPKPDPQSGRIKCNLCERDYKNQKTYKDHMKSFHELERYTCTKCNVSFSFKCALAQHQRTSRSCPESAPGPSKTKLKHSCDVCKKEFAQKRGLQRHVNVSHMGKLGHLCSDCGKGFSEPYLLRRHQLVHSGVKEEICEICGKEYRWKSQLTEHHRKEHSGISEMK